MKIKHQRWRDFAFNNIKANGAQTVMSLLETTMSNGWKEKRGHRREAPKKPKIQPNTNQAANLLRMDRRFKCLGLVTVASLGDLSGNYEVQLWGIHEGYDE